MQEKVVLIGKPKPSLLVSVREWCKAVNNGHKWSDTSYRYDDGKGMKWLINQCKECGTEVFLPVVLDAEDKRQAFAHGPLVQIGNAA